MILRRVIEHVRAYDILREFPDISAEGVMACLQ
jgi:uncharacterized protein (DUF433 family)